MGIYLLKPIFKKTLEQVVTFFKVNNKGEPNVVVLASLLILTRFHLLLWWLHCLGGECPLRLYYAIKNRAITQIEKLKNRLRFEFRSSHHVFSCIREPTDKFSCLHDCTFKSDTKLQKTDKHWRLMT